MTDLPLLPITLLAPAGDLPEPPASPSISRKKASTACSACRARRSKCTGGIPCLSCVSHRTDCLKDENEDGRRRVAIKRKLEGLEEDRDTLDNLIAVLKHGSESQITLLVGLIRTNTSRVDLCAFLDEARRSPEPNTRDSIEQQWKVRDHVGGSHSQRRPRTGGISDLINPPTQVPAKPWTQVTDDDDFVSHLISLWFTWLHPWFRWVEETIFIEAMQSQDVNNPLCAPYLVSSILAEACLLDASDTKETSYHTRLRDKFLAEAKAGMEAEQGKVSLTLIQATGVQWTNLYLSGDDRKGRLVLVMQIFLTKGLTKWRGQLSRHFQTSPPVLQKIDKCLTNVEWALFSLNAFNLTDYHNFHAFTQPTKALPETSHESAPNSKWFPYPMQRNIPCEFHEDCHFVSLVSLAEKMAENENISAERERGRDHDDQFRRLIQALQDWPSTLPSCMQQHMQATPHALALHALYSWVILVLAKQAAAAAAGRPSDFVITSTPPSRDGYHWHSMAMQRAVAIAEIMHCYSRSWGDDYFPPVVMQPISLALLTLLEGLRTEEHRGAFVVLSKTLRAISRKYRVGQGVMHVVRSAIRQKGISVPPEAEQIYELNERQTSDGDASSEGSSRRTEFLTPERDITVDYLLEKWEDLKLDGDVN